MICKESGAPTGRWELKIIHTILSGIMPARVLDEYSDLYKSSIYCQPRDVDQAVKTVLIKSV